MRCKSSTKYHLRLYTGHRPRPDMGGAVSVYWTGGSTQTVASFSFDISRVDSGHSSGEQQAATVLHSGLLSSAPPPLCGVWCVVCPLCSGGGPGSVVRGGV